MAVFRIEKTRDYTVMANHHLRNRALSLKSKGLLSMMLSLPEDWNYTTRGLEKICKEGTDSIGSTLKELERAGYIVRNRLRDSKGKIVDVEYVIYETPHSPDTGQPCEDEPDTACPDTENPDMETSPKLTADWEQRLNEVAKGQASPEDFMDGIEAMAAELVWKYSHISEDGRKLFQPEKETVGLCPRCGKPVYEGKKNFACSDRACQFVMWKNDRFWTSRRKEMTRKMAADLLKKGRTSVKGLWSEKKGSTYDAVVILDDTGGKYVNFKLEFPKRKDGVHGKK